MPYVNIRVTREGVTPEQKQQLIEGATDLLVRVLDKNPATTFVIIDEVETDNWGVARDNVTTLRQREAAARHTAGN
ncbi:MAG TPA: 4-oxalocrotonate tautomerase family protein [Burkholderiaceae bacterium]|jgi:4-oxalocrotonate tautomerase|nr:4-oxalocrotonate tautomerase family protein [Burkholderiaceae bacterium]